MYVKIIEEAGLNPSLLGLGLSFKNTNKSFDDLLVIAERLAGKSGGHDKFMRQIAVWLDVQAPLFWWKELDQYKVATTTQSESTMHTIMKKRLEQSDFESHIYWSTLENLNYDILINKNFEKVINNLPDGFLQRRIIFTNYAQLGNIIKQRKGHKMKQWKIFIDSVLEQISYPNLLGIGKVVR